MVKDRPFDELEYTRDREIKALLDIQDHASDGSALEGCTCLQGKHFYKLESNSEEGITIASRDKEKQFYAKMAPFAREARKAIVDQSFDFPEVDVTHVAGLTKCEKKLVKCLETGKTEEECRALVHCQ